MIERAKHQAMNADMFSDGVGGDDGVHEQLAADAASLRGPVHTEVRKVASGEKVVLPTVPILIFRQVRRRVSADGKR